MTDHKENPAVLTSDPKVLHKIKYMQFRRQMIPIGVVILLLIANLVYPQKLYFYPTLAAFAWFLLERMFFRTKNKIAVPPAGAFVAPVNGKIQSLRLGGESTLITIRKSWLDIVELRLPYPGLRMESNREWFFNTLLGQIGLKIESNSLTFFENKNIKGDVIGVIPFSAIITISVPSGIPIKVKEGQPVFGGETALFSLGESSSEEVEPKSILVEEPLQDLS